MFSYLFFLEGGGGQKHPNELMRLLLKKIFTWISNFFSTKEGKNNLNNYKLQNDIILEWVSLCLFISQLERGITCTGKTKITYTK